MNVPDSADIVQHISIPISALGDDLNCPVCMNVIKPAVLTHCGHRFCETCIRTSVGTWKKCPVCNQKLTQDELILDKGFDNLVTVIETQKTEAADTYFKQVAGNAISGLEEAGHVTIHNACIRPILQKHLKKSLLEFELYSQQLQQDLSDQAMAALIGNSNGSIEMASHQSELLQSCLSAVVESYDRYLSDNLPPMTLLPVTVQVKIHSKDRVSLPLFKFQPSTSIEDLYKMVHKHLSQGADPIIEFSRDQISFILIRPSVIGQVNLTSDLIGSLHAQQLSQDYSYSSAPVIVMADRSFPLLAYHLTPGSQVVLFGNIKFASDLPKSCFSSVFKKDAGMKMDYFSCQECSLKWICKPCKESCHEGHKLAVHVRNHTPTWSCCYCKKRQCLLSVRQPPTAESVPVPMDTAGCSTAS